MKKTLLTIALMLALGLTACGGGGSNSSDSSLPDSSESSESSSESSETSSESSETSSESSSETANSFVISNKDDLEAAWLLGEANRTMEFTSDPAMNVQLEINNGNLVVESSNTNVVSVSGRVLTAAGEGNATITASWRGLTDSVDVEVSPKAPVMTLEEIRAGIAAGTYGEGSVIDFYGRVTGTMEPTEDHLYSGVYVQDGDYAMMLYAGTLDENWFGGELAIGDDVYVKGTLSPYSGLMEVKPTELRLMTEEDNYTVNTPTVLTLTGDNWSTDALMNQDSRLFVAENAIYKSGTISSPTSHSTIKFELTKEDGTKVEADLRLNYHIGVEQMTALQTKINGLSAGAVVDLKGVIGWYNAPQMSLQFLAGATPDECMVVHQQADPETIEITNIPENLTVGQTTTLSVSVTPSGANAAVDWESSNTSVATITSTGLVTALSEGTTTITATSTAVPTISDSFELAVGASVAEPEYKLIASLDDVLNDTAADKTQIYLINGVEATDVKGDKYGNMYLVNGTDKVQVYGSTASLDAFSFDFNTRTYSYTNKQNFLENKFTSAIKDGDSLDLLVIRDEYKGNKQLNAVIRGVNDVVIPSIVATTDSIQGTAMNTFVATELTGVIVGWQYSDSENGSQFGNVTIKTEGATSSVLIYGLTAQQSCLQYDADGQIVMNNPKDFLTNPATSSLAIDDTITVVGVRCDYKGAVQIKGYLVVA